MACDPALSAGNEPVAKPDVPEGPSDHHLVVPPTGTEGVELFRIDGAISQPPRGRAVLRDLPRRGDVVRGHGVSQQRKHPGLADGSHLLRIRGQPVEEGGLPDVGGCFHPPVPAASRHLDGVPALAAREDRRICLVKDLGAKRGADHPFDLRLPRPEIPQVDRLPVMVNTDGVRGQVYVHRSRQGIGDHERRGREVARLDRRVDPSLEIAVARKHRGHRQVVFPDGPVHGFGERARVADARGAPVPDEMESEGFQVRGEPRAVEVHRDSARARREACLDMGRHAQAPAARHFAQGALRRSSRPGSTCSCSW